MLVSLCTETIEKPVFEGDENLTAVEGNASDYQMYPVSRITGEGGAEFFRAWGRFLRVWVGFAACPHVTRNGEEQ